VVNEQGDPVSGAKVFAGKNSVQTDQNGVFLFINEVVNANGAYVRVEHPAYFHGSRTVTVDAATRNTVRIQLLAKQPQKFINAATGGKADFGDYSVALPAGGVRYADDSSKIYNGSVGLAVKWLDPTAPNLFSIMPGRLTGRARSGALSGMISMGMLAVELSGASGELLQMRKGFEAEIRMKVPVSLFKSAPATIPLWYFDEQASIWVEEGEAKLTNGFYTGKVKHFSFWNYDVPIPVVEMRFKVVSSDGKPIENARVRLKIIGPDTLSVGEGFTDNKGVAIGLVAKDKKFEAEIYAPFDGCNEPVLVQNIGPFTQNGASTFTISLDKAKKYSITGELTDCNGKPTTNGYVKVKGKSAFAWTDAQGRFDLSLLSCTPLSTETITGFDLTTQKSSKPLIQNVSSGSANAGENTGLRRR
jgi:hypothetical protein